MFVFMNWSTHHFNFGNAQVAMLCQRVKKCNYRILPNKHACLNKHAPATFNFDKLYLRNYSTIQGSTLQISLKSDKDEGSLSASAPSAFIRRNTIVPYSGHIDRCISTAMRCLLQFMKSWLDRSHRSHSLCDYTGVRLYAANRIISLVMQVHSPSQHNKACGLVTMVTRYNIEIVGHANCGAQLHRNSLINGWKSVSLF